MPWKLPHEQQQLIERPVRTGTPHIMIGDHAKCSISVMKKMHMNLRRHGALYAPKMKWLNCPPLLTAQIILVRPYPMVWCSKHSLTLLLIYQAVQNVLKGRSDMYRAREQNKYLHDEWTVRLSEWMPEQLVYVDELQSQYIQTNRVRFSLDQSYRIGAERIA